MDQITYICSSAIASMCIKDSSKNPLYNWNEVSKKFESSAKGSYRYFIEDIEKEILTNDKLYHEENTIFFKPHAEVTLVNNQKYTKYFDNYESTLAYVDLINSIRMTHPNGTIRIEY